EWLKLRKELGLAAGPLDKRGGMLQRWSFLPLVSLINIALSVDHVPVSSNSYYTELGTQWQGEP
ncbi:MAG: hypothetical protein ACK2U2_10650, partial [Anaerolineae bacterium]